MNGDDTLRAMKAGAISRLSLIPPVREACVRTRCRPNRNLSPINVGRIASSHRDKGGVRAENTQWRALRNLLPQPMTA
jgi:hypothetical protein